MSGFEHYLRELDELDHEIRHYAAACGVDLALPGEAGRVLSNHRSDDRRGFEDLYGLLQLRLKIETEMLELGIQPPPFVQVHLE